MKGYSYVSGEVFSKAEIKLWYKATYLINELYEGEKIRCHELVRAVERILRYQGTTVRTEVVDGKYFAVEHSWILLTEPVTQTINHFRHILDVYVPGQLPMVQLVDWDYWGLPHRQVYFEGEPRTDIDEQVVDSLVREMKYG